MTSADERPATEGTSEGPAVREDDRLHALTALRRCAAVGSVSAETFDRQAGVLMTTEEPREITALLTELDHRGRRGAVARAAGRLSAYQRTVRQAWVAQRHPRLVLPPSARHPLSIGRAPGSVLRISDASVSRFHAQLALAEGSWTLRDIGSANGTWVNDIRVLTSMPVGSEDVVRFGAVAYRLVIP